MLGSRSDDPRCASGRSRRTSAPTTTVQTELTPNVADTLARAEGGRPARRHHLRRRAHPVDHAARSTSSATGCSTCSTTGRSPTRSACYKPAPEIFEHALAGLGGVDPAEAAHVGDLRRTDIAGARAMGILALRYRGVNDDEPAHGARGRPGRRRPRRPSPAAGVGRSRLTTGSGRQPRCRPPGCRSLRSAPVVPSARSARTSRST